MADSGQRKQYYILALILFIERKLVFGFVSSACVASQNQLCVYGHVNVFLTGELKWHCIDVHVLKISKLRY